MCFHLFRSSLISFSTVFYFSAYKSYTPLDRFIPKYFTLFRCYYKWSCFINFILDYLNAIIQLNFVCYSCKLQPCLLNLFINYSFLMFVLGFSIYKIMFSVNRDSLISFFPVWMPFVYFPCLIALARISRQSVSNRDGSSSHPCPVLDHRRKACSLSPLSMILTVAFSYIAFTYVEIVSFYS